MTRTFPLTPIWDPRKKTGSISTGNTPGTPIACVPELTLIGFLADDTIWEGDSTGLTRDGDYVYVMSFFWGASRINGIAIVDVSTPATPTLVSTFEISDNAAMDEPNAAVKDGNYLYVVCHGSDALVILDVSTPATPTFVGEANGFSTGFPSSPDGLVKDGNYVYTAGSTRGIVTFDVTTPASPSVVGQCATSGFNLYDVVKIGNYLYASEEGVSDGLTVFDVSTPTLPVFVTRLTDALIGSDPREVAAAASHVFMACPGTDTIISVDVSTPGTPTIVDSITDGTNLNGVYGLCLDGDYLYSSSSAGVVAVFDVSDPTAMALVDTVGPDVVNSSTDLGAGIVKSGQYIHTNGWTLAAIDTGCP